MAKFFRCRNYPRRNCLLATSLYSPKPQRVAKNLQNAKHNKLAKRSASFKPMGFNPRVGNGPSCKELPSQIIRPSTNAEFDATPAEIQTY